jgi:hypothetical protein
MNAEEELAYKLLGVGSFGGVFEPALPNVNAAGNPVEFPGQVTKLFFKRGAYDKALANAAILERKAPALHIPYATYTRNTRRRNIPRTIRKELKRRGKPDDKVYLIRMPHKGISFIDIIKNPVYLAKFRAIPTEVKLREIYKLMNIVKGLGDAGYVHADIRETNVLMYPETGVMTLLDFDLMRAKDTFIATYPKPYYHVPPEAAIFLEADLGYGKTFWDIFNKYIVLKRGDVKTFYRDDIFGDKSYYYYGIHDEFHSTFAEEIIDFAETLAEVLRTIYSENDKRKELREHLQDIFVNTADSFALAYCLRFLFQYDTDDRLKAFLMDDLFPKMMHGHLSKRADIEAAMRLLKEFAQAEYGVDLDAPTAQRAAAVVAAEAARLEGEAAAAGGIGPAAARPSSLHSGSTLGSLRLSASPNKRNSASAGVARLASAVAALAAVVDAPAAAHAPALPAKKLTRTQRRRAQRKRAKTRNQARAAAAGSA